MKNEIRYAYHPATDKVIHISDVPVTNRGLRCGCICKDCEGVLEAVLGTEKIHYFRHSNHTCSGENTIHLLIKQTIAESKDIKLPKGWVNYSNVRLEKALDTRRPDVTIEVNDKDLYIEGRVTHAIDDVKKKFYVEGKHRCFEIDFSDRSLWVLPPDELKRIILEETDNKTLIEWHEWETKKNAVEYKEKSAFNFSKIVAFIAAIGLIIMAVILSKRKRIF